MMLHQIGILGMLVGLLLLAVPLASGMLGAGPIPPEYVVVDSKTVVIPRVTELEPLYYPDGRMSTYYDLPTDDSRFPISFTMENYALTLTGTYQDDEGVWLTGEWGENHFKIGIVRRTMRTFPVELRGGDRLYITRAQLPERSGDWRRADNTYFYGFDLVTLSLARLKGAPGPGVYIYAPATAVVGGLLVAGRRGLALALALGAIATTAVLSLGPPHRVSVDAFNRRIGEPVSVEVWIDGEHVGTTPFTTYLLPGEYTVRVPMTDGYGDPFVGWSDGVTANPRRIWVPVGPKGQTITALYGQPERPGAALVEPTLRYPADGKHVFTPTVRFEWSAVEGARYYEVWIDNQPGFPSPIVCFSLGETAEIPLTDGAYYWKVRAHGSTSGWSDTRLVVVSSGVTELPELAVDGEEHPLVYSEDPQAARGIPGRELFLAAGAVLFVAGFVAFMVGISPERIKKAKIEV